MNILSRLSPWSLLRAVVSWNPFRWIARPELREAEESRAIYEVGGVTDGDRDSHRKAWEVVPR